LIACSVLALAIIFERLFALRTNKVLPQNALVQAIESTRQGFPSDETIHEIAKIGAVGSVFSAGLQTLASNPSASHADVKESMEMEGRMAAQNLERYLTSLATLASAAPLLGLLGTVIGMIEIFGSQQGVGANPQQLANGISIALYNTALGLLIAIPAYAGWRGLKAMAEKRQRECDVAAKKLLAHLNSN